MYAKTLKNLNITCLADYANMSSEPLFSKDQEIQNVEWLAAMGLFS